MNSSRGCSPWLSWGGIPRRCASQADVGNLREGVLGGYRDYQGELVKLLVHNHAKFPLSVSLSVSLALSLSVCLPPSLGGETVEERPLRVRQAATRGECMARRAPTGICGTVQPATPRRARLSWIMDCVRKRRLSETCHHTSAARPEAAELQIDDHRSLNGSWRRWKLNEPRCQNKQRVVWTVEEAGIVNIGANNTTWFIIWM